MTSDFSESFDPDSEKLSFDWETCETLQVVKAFPISDYGTKSDESSSDMVPEPASVSGIIDSTSNNSSSSDTASKEAKDIEDDLYSFSNVSDINVTNALQKHEYEKERVERKGKVYDKLYNACLKGQISIINDILKTCTTALMPDQNGQTPIYAACIGRHPEVVNLLIDSGYDVNHQDNDGKTPLHTAFEHHEPELAETLITLFHARTDIRDNQNYTPLHTAFDRGYNSYSQQLSRLLHQDIGTEVSWIQLQAACFNENAHDVKLILDSNTDVNRSSSVGLTSLHIAVTKSNIDLVILLLNKNVDVDNKADGKTPLHAAMEKGDETIIQKLLAYKADINLKDVRGNTVLHSAVQIRQDIQSWILRTGVSSRSLYPASHQAYSIQTVQAIINLSANVNAVNNRGQTPLWLACADGQEQFVKMLLHNGADPNIADDFSDFCLHSAMYGTMQYRDYTGTDSSLC